MSNKFWLPPQKGTDLYPVVGQVPIRVRVRGAEPGSPEYARLVAQHQGVLSQFIMKQRHAYSLSTIPIQQGRIDRDGVTMTYQNQNGLEIATLEVRPTTQGGAQLIKAPAKPWDWALLQVEVPNAWSADMAAGGFSARRIVPTPTEPSLRFEGWAYNDGVEGDDDITYMDDGRSQPVLAWAPYSSANPPFLAPVEIKAGASGDTQVVSMKIDLTQFSSASAVVADIYGYLGAKLMTVITQYHVSYATPIVNSSIPTTVGSTVFNSITGQYTPSLSTFWPYEFPSPTWAITAPGFPTSVAVSAMPAVIPAPSYNTNYVIDELTLHNPSGLMETITGHIMDLVFTGNPGPNQFAYSVVITETVRTYLITTSTGSAPGYAERDVSLRGNGGFGTPDWQYSRTQVPGEGWSASRWEWGASYPTPIPTSLLRDGVRVTSDDPQLLGRLTVDPKLHSISFKPAT